MNLKSNNFSGKWVKLDGDGNIVRVEDWGFPGSFPATEEIVDENGVLKFKPLTTLFKINKEASEKILAGFDYEINNQLLHFSYNEYDQINFVDMANACLLFNSDESDENLIFWKGYDKITNECVSLQLTRNQFFDLYINGAQKHKINVLKEAQEKKDQLLKNVEDEN